MRGLQRAHHVHAVVEGDLPQLLPAHYAQVVLILIMIFLAWIRQLCGCLQTHANVYVSAPSVEPQFSSSIPLAPLTSCKYRLRRHHVSHQPSNWICHSHTGCQMTDLSAKICYPVLQMRSFPSEACLPGLVRAFLSVKLVVEGHMTLIWAIAAACLAARSCAVCLMDKPVTCEA